MVVISLVGEFDMTWMLHTSLTKTLPLFFGDRTRRGRRSFAVGETVHLRIPENALPTL